jgi:FkbM family methyltransferase
MRAMSGPMLGMRWVVGSMPHGAWLGTLEREKLRRFIGELRPGMTVWDIGANVGLYTLPSARAIRSEGRLYAFEPLLRNCEFLRTHVKLNRLSNVEIVQAAVYDGSARVRMADGDSPSEFHVDAQGDHVMPAISLDTWRAATGSAPPDIVKIDVEGAEAAVLRGASETFSQHRPVLFLALHGELQKQECEALLRNWKYTITSLDRVPISNSSEWFAQAN